MQKQHRLFAYFPISSFITHHSSLQRELRFTLIELLVIIATIAILAGLLLPTLNAAQGKSRDTSCVSNKKQAALAQAQYASDYNGFWLVAAPCKNFPLWNVVLSGHKPAALKTGYCEWSVLICTGVPTDPKKYSDDYTPICGKASHTIQWHGIGMVEEMAPASLDKTGRFLLNGADSTSLDATNSSTWSVANTGLLKAPGDTVALADCLRKSPCSHGYGKFMTQTSYESSVYPVHSGRAAVACFDGSAKAMGLSELKNCANLFTKYMASASSTAASTIP